MDMMPLSWDEQRKLDELEQALRADDPTFDAGVNFVRARRHRAIVGAVVALLGWVLLLAGVVATQSLLGLGVQFSFIGSVGMLAVAGWSAVAESRCRPTRIGYPTGRNGERPGEGSARPSTVGNRPITRLATRPGSCP